MSGWKEVSSGVHQGSVLSPVLFNIFFNGLNSEIEYMLTTFVDGTKLGGVANTLQGRAWIQNDLNQLKKWSAINKMKFSMDKCEALYLGQNNCMPKYRLGNELAYRIAKDLGFAVNYKLSISHQCAFITGVSQWTELDLGVRGQATGAGRLSTSFKVTSTLHSWSNLLIY